MDLSNYTEPQMLNLRYIENNILKLESDKIERYTKQLSALKSIISKMLCFPYYKKWREAAGTEFPMLVNYNSEKENARIAIDRWFRHKDLLSALNRSESYIGFSFYPEHDNNMFCLEQILDENNIRYIINIEENILYIPKENISSASLSKIEWQLADIFYKDIMSVLESKTDERKYSLEEIIKKARS